MDYTMGLLAALACVLTLATIAVYERMLNDARRENVRLEADCDLFSELLNEALDRRHPARRDSTPFYVVDTDGAA